MQRWARVIEDSIHSAGPRLTTLQLRYPRFIHSEFMTHRLFSRNASSSRAIPVAKIIAGVEETPVVPLVFGKNMRGMQAREDLSPELSEQAQAVWLEGMRHAVETARKLADLGVHKQHANRVLEPYAWIDVVVTSTKFHNFFEQRDHRDAQPEIRKLAADMRAVIAASWPKTLKSDEWHLPYVSAEERKELPRAQQLMSSVARCARVSYSLHDGTAPDADKDKARYESLLFERHYSPFEHQATPDPWRLGMGGNFGSGWTQYRKTLPNELLCES